jgi:hypothetical protein
VDDLVTVYCTQETNEAIGSLIKGVSKFCADVFAKMSGFEVEIRDRRVRLMHTFLARLWSSERDPREWATLTYQS